MSPIDDELRDALHRRATGVAPSPDPLSGIERRATRIQRNRLAASVAGSVLAVAAVATAVPLLSGTSPAPDVPPVASAPPSREPSPSPSPSRVPSPSPYALDPEVPWDYRGAPPADLGDGTVETVREELATRRGVEPSSVALSPLFGQLYEPSGQVEIVYVAQVDGEPSWGVARSSEAGPELAVDEPLAEGTTALVAALPGDEVARLLVVASPEVGEISYGHDDASEWSPMAALADGVATTPLDGDPATDAVRVLGAQGQEVHRDAAPDVAAPGGEPEAPPASEPPTPTNVVDWPVRGAVSDDLRERAVASFAQAAGVPVSQLRTRLLFGGQRDGRTYVLLQGWYGGDARSFAWSYDPRGDQEQALLQGFTPPGPALFTAVLDGVLLVVPEPAAGQVLYAPDASSEPQPVADQGTEVAVLIDRADGASGDRLLVLDGDGDPEAPIFRGTVDDAVAATR